MKIFSWIRSKRYRNEETNNASTPKPKSFPNKSSKEELRDWPNSLLAIGTFGNQNNLKHAESLENEADNSSGQDMEAVDRELRLLLNSKQITAEGLIDCLRRKEIQLDNRNKGINKKSLSFLIKKALLCGAVPPPSILKDPLPDTKSDLSRMDKILRALLHKKIYPQRPTPKKYLDTAEAESESDDEGSEEDDRRSKWVKTDSEYIVLEM